MPDLPMSQSETWKARAQAEFNRSSGLMMRVERLETAVLAALQSDLANTEDPAEALAARDAVMNDLRRALYA